MGLDISHNAWHGAYGAFHRWRRIIAQYAGIPLELMEGFYNPGDVLNDPFRRIELNTLSLNASDKEDLSRNIADLRAGLPIRWNLLKPRAIHELLYHSDCDGSITWRKAKKIADELSEILKLIPEDLDGVDYTENTNRQGIVTTTTIPSGWVLELRYVPSAT